VSTLRGTRIIVSAALYGGAGLGVAGAAAFSVLAAQTALARRLIGVPTQQPPDADGWYQPVSHRTPGPALSFVVLGDSTSVSLGADRPEQSMGALIAAGLAEMSGRHVRLTTHGFVGARSVDLDEQVSRALVNRPTVALIIVGVNDVTHRVRPAVSVRMLDAAVRRLRDAGCEVVVGTCPDLGTIEPIPHPLRWIARRWSRELASAQTVVAVDAGARSVSLSTVLGPEFAAAPTELFSEDRFHPGPVGYASAAAAILPSIAAAVGALEPDDAPDPVSGGVLPVAVAAARAAEYPGMEVVGTSVRGRDSRGRGRWATLRYRRRQVTGNAARVAAPEDAQ
jgi:lysophospholipase L1-like esterase